MSPRRVERAYATLLYLYPPAFRREHGREMRQFVHAAVANHASAAVFVRILMDLARAVPREWIHTAASPKRDRALFQRGTSRSSKPMTTMFQDLRYSLRLLVKNPGFTAAAS